LTWLKRFSKQELVMKKFTRFDVALIPFALVLAGAAVAQDQAPGGQPQGKAPPALKNDVVSMPRAARIATTATPAFKIAVYYVIPSDLEFEQAVYDRLVESTLDIQPWYQCATGGVTWELAFPEVVRVYLADKTREEYNTGVPAAYFGTITAELESKGLANTPGTILGLWARGGPLDAYGAQGCGVQCGAAFVNIEIFPEFNKPEWTAGKTCPAGQGVAAFPCTPVGAFAHELGHAFGLPHPFDVAETHDVAFHSLMQTHWNYPDFASGVSEDPWGFLTLERQTLRKNPFLKKDVALIQPHDCDVVNLPDAGPPPRVNFRERLRGLTLTVQNQTRFPTRQAKGDPLYYWTFGDGTVSNDDSKRLLHQYQQAGTYPVTLRASGKEAVIDLIQHQVTVSGGAIQGPSQ
jgi:hypothetical protein